MLMFTVICTIINIKIKKMKKTVMLLLIASIFTMQSCKKDEPAAETPNNVRLVTNASHGTILTDKDGMSLYFFSDDANGTSACTSGCLNNWPIFYTDNLTLDNGLEASDFATITRADGSMQTTYKGWPLYYYVTDAAEGDTFGDGINGDWYIAKPDYTVMFVYGQLHGHDGNDYTSDYTVGTGEIGYIVDAYGKTLYTFSHDTNNVNTFTASDFGNNAVWPVAELTGAVVPSNLSSADFGTITVYGHTQLTYKGWPLYYFGQDSARGDNKGISFPAAGVWPVANTTTVVAP